MHEDRFLEAKFQECLLGIQLGDAMGMPVEIMTPSEILAATDGRGVTGFIDPVQRRIHDTMDLKAGDTTDDWQLTRVVGESIVTRGGYDQKDQAQRHIEAMQRSRFGWGGTTTKGIESLISGRNPHDPPPDLGPGRGCGNGVAMKIAPIPLFVTAAFGHDSRDLLRGLTLAHGKLTHPDPRAWLAGHAIAFGIRHVLLHPLPRGGGWTMNRHRDRFMQAVTDEIAEVETALHGRLDPPEEMLSVRLRQAHELIGDPIALRETVGTGCIALESVPFALATFARHYDSFIKGVLEAVNAGGDTDTTAAMVGALIGANGGGQSWTARTTPMAWVEALPDKGEEAKRLGSALYLTAISNRPSGS